MAAGSGCMAALDAGRGWGRDMSVLADRLPEAVLGEGGQWLHPEVMTTGASLVRAVNWASLLTPELAELCPAVSLR